MKNWRVIVALASAILLVVFVGAYAADWTSEDIGDAANTPGSDEEVNGEWTINADGNDIWGNADGFRFVYQEVSGDFEISCQVLSIQNTHDWAKAGVMARSSNAANASFAFSFVTVATGVMLEWRTADGAGAGPVGEGLPETAPYYVKLVREGDDFKSFRSQDGENWEDNHAVGHPSEINIAMDNPILVGLALTSHSAGVLCEAKFDSLEGSFLDVPVEPAGKLPTVWAEIKSRH